MFDRMAAVSTQATYEVFVETPYLFKTPCPAYDALVALYVATAGSDWTTNTAWMNGDPCDGTACDTTACASPPCACEAWSGITCVGDDSERRRALYGGVELGNIGNIGNIGNSNLSAARRVSQDSSLLVSTSTPTPTAHHYRSLSV